MKRTFRNNALIAGLIERRMPKGEKTGRQITLSTDLIYDVLRSHEAGITFCCKRPGRMQAMACSTSAVSPML